MMYIKTNLPGRERAIRIALGIMVAGLACLVAPSPMMTWIGAASRSPVDADKGR
jgi:hypothetical protein